jgi:hypothetical protein
MGTTERRKEEKKGKEACRFAPSFPSIKLLVSDSLRGSSSNISEAKNGVAGYTFIERVPLTGKDVQGA